MWLHNDNEVETLPDDCVGFVYIITNLKTNRKYVGKKLAKFSKTTYKTVVLKNGKKKKKKGKSKKKCVGRVGTRPPALWRCRTLPITTKNRFI